MVSTPFYNQIVSLRAGDIRFALQRIHSRIPESQSYHQVVLGIRIVNPRSRSKSDYIRSWRLLVYEELLYNGSN